MVLEKGLSPMLQPGDRPVMMDHESRRDGSAHVLAIPYPSPPHILPMLDLAHQLASRGDITVTFVTFQVFIDRLLQEESKREGSLSSAIRLVGVPDDLPGFNPPTEIIKKPIVLRESLQLGHNLEPFVQRVLQDRESLGIEGPTCLVVDFIHWWSTSVLESDGVLLNTGLAVESQAVDSLRIMLRDGMPLMPVGPLGMSPALPSPNISMEGLQLSDEAGLMNWLDQQPPSSVIYVCFGTTGMNNLGKRHVLELATGLEASQQRFVWVLRAPPDVHDIVEILPGGFQVRVRGRGLLLTGWAPQKQILAHPSTGGFLSSCGWNSTLESLMRGIPIIGWPSFADQPTICRYMSFIAKVAIELPRQAGHFVEADEIKKAIVVMLLSEEGTAMRERAGHYKTGIAEALAPGGSSNRAVQEFADLIRHRPSSTFINSAA